MTDQSAPALKEIFNVERLHAVIPLDYPQSLKLLYALARPNRAPRLILALCGALLGLLRSPARGKPAHHNVLCLPLKVV